MKISSLQTIAALFLSLWAQLAIADAMLSIENLVGKAYAPESGELLYEEHHRFEYQDGRIVGAEVTYIRADGEQIAHKTLDYRQSPSVPAFHTVQYGGRFIEGLTYTDDGRLKLYNQKEGGDLNSKVIDSAANMTADAGFNNHVHQHYQQLLDGETVKFRITVPNHLTSVKFKARRIGERELKGLKLVDFKISMDSLFGLFVDPLVISYDTASKLLIEYQGLTNIRAPNGELYEARIVYPQLLQQSTAALQ